MVCGDDLSAQVSTGNHCLHSCYLHNVNKVSLICCHVKFGEIWCAVQYVESAVKMLLNKMSDEDE